MNPFSWLRSVHKNARRRKRIDAIVFVDSLSDVPAKTGGALYVVGDRDKAKWAALSCPCKCGARIDVNLMQSRKPAWTITYQGDTASFKPSLWRPKGTCGSHFWIARNQINWV
jgi:hypothetical protein